MEIFKEIEAENGDFFKIQLTYEERQRNRLRKKDENGYEILIIADRGKVLREGQVFGSSTGKVIQIDCAKEQLLHIVCEKPMELLKVIYHLGNRHAKVQIKNCSVRILADPILEDMVSGIGAKVTKVSDSFEAESGAYVHGNNKKNAATIHEFTDTNEN